LLPAFVETSIAGVSPDANGEHDLIHVLTAALSGGHRARRAGAGRGIDNRHVALTCIDYVATIGRLPSIRELCLVAHVSERRLRDAFREVYGLPPTRYFRDWALGEARRRLATAEPGVETVTEIAMNLGFAHTGRFSGRYRALFDEAPSVTLGSRY
jgi:AraC-like DNA-binding protein